MIILDTNVVSEPLRPAPEPAVLEWLDRQEPETLYLTVINLAELLTGIAVMPSGRRRLALQQSLEERILPLFGERILPFDSRAAEAFSRIHTQALAAGCAIGFVDGAIAAIASAHGFAIATRNVRGFRETGVQIMNPWEPTA